MKKIILMMSVMMFSGIALAQPDEELTEKEKAYRDSIAAINSANEQNAESREAYNAGIELFTAGKFKQAIQKYNESIKVDPEFLDAYYNKAVAENEAGMFKDAVSTTTGLIGKEKSGKAYFQRARAHQGLNDFSKAEADYEAAYDLDKNNEKLVYNFGTLKFLQKDYEGAKSMFDKAIAIKSDFGFAYNDRGSCHRMLKDYPAAIADYEKASKYNPNSAFILNNIGTVKKKMGDPSGAIAAYNRALSIDKSNHMSYNNRGSVLFDQGKYDDAIRDFNKAIELSPKYAPAFNNRGNVKFKKEDYKSAEADYTKAIQINPNYTNAYLNRGIARERLRNEKGACDDWGKARELGSDLAGEYQSTNCQ